MIKSFVWVGVGLLTLGALVFVLFVLPQIGGSGPVTVLPNGETAGRPSVLAVAVSSLGLAAGSALLGIGLGRWRHPRPSVHDGSPEV